MMLMDPLTEALTEKKERISLSISKELLSQIDLMRGLIPRSALIEAILRWALENPQLPDLYRLMNAYRGAPPSSS